MSAKEIVETLTFWLLLTAIFALLVVVESHLWLPHALLCAANLGAKAVRKELSEAKP
jgi:hypothetical protein